MNTLYQEIDRLTGENARLRIELKEEKAAREKTEKAVDLMASWMNAVIQDYQGDVDCPLDDGRECICSDHVDDDERECVKHISIWFLSQGMALTPPSEEERP